MAKVKKEKSLVLPEHQLVTVDWTAEDGCAFKLELSSGAELEVLIFSMDEHRWIFNYYYQKRECLRNVVFVNDVKMVVDYQQGLATKCNLSMHIIFPEKFGKIKYLGVDISPGAELFVQFKYRVEGSGSKFYFRLYEIEIGAGNKFFCRENAENEDTALIEQVGTFFPVKLIL